MDHNAIIIFFYMATLSRTVFNNKKSKPCPAIKKTIIEERDIYMACKIIQTVRIMGVGSEQDGMRRKIVVIVGAGHCPGIKDLLSREMKVQGALSVEEELRKVVQTKRHTIENDPEILSLITDVASIEPVTYAIE
jgi:pheromone shutdown protein TraB